MRIDPLQSPAVKPAESAQPVDKPAGVAGRTPTDLRSDAVELSRLSQALTGEVEKDARLDELRVRVAEGTYQVPAADLSKRIVDSLLSAEE